MLCAFMRRTTLIGALVMIGCGAEERVAFVAGSAEDEAAIREIIGQGEALHYADDVDWENAFGGRFLGKEAVERFVTEMVEPTLSSAEREPASYGSVLGSGSRDWRLLLANGGPGWSPSREGWPQHLPARAQWHGMADPGSSCS